MHKLPGENVTLTIFSVNAEHTDTDTTLYTQFATKIDAIRGFGQTQRSACKNRSRNETITNALKFLPNNLHRQKKSGEKWSKVIEKI